MDASAISLDCRLFIENVAGNVVVRVLVFDALGVDIRTQLLDDVDGSRGVVDADVIHATQCGQHFRA